MKKLVLVLILAFGFVNFADAKEEVPNRHFYKADHCWEIADAVEAYHCGYVGCDYDWWEYVYETCEHNLK